MSFPHTLKAGQSNKICLTERGFLQNMHWVGSHLARIRNEIDKNHFQSKYVNMSVYFDVIGQAGMDFFTRGTNNLDYREVFWVKNKCLKIKNLNVFVLTNMQIFTSLDIDWYTVVVCINCDVYFSCLNSHSDSTHYTSDAMIHLEKINSNKVNSANSFLVNCSFENHLVIIA